MAVYIRGVLVSMQKLCVDPISDATFDSLHQADPYIRSYLSEIEPNPKIQEALKSTNFALKYDKAMHMVELKKLKKASTFFTQAIEAFDAASDLINAAA